METIIPNWIFHNWQRKLIALLSAIIIWVFVDYSITSTKTLIGVPIKVIHLPQGKTISGMSGDGTLNRRMNLVISGKKNVIDNLEAGDLEIILDASNVPDEWIVLIGKKNLVSFSDKVDLQKHVNTVTHQEFIINLSNLIKDKIPIRIRPKGNPPEGYELLGVWPQTLFQTVSGPEEQVLALRAKGIKLTFDLNSIKTEEIESHAKVRTDFLEDEISVPMPEAWKKVFIPFLGNNLQPINDPNASQLHLDFLRVEYFKIDVPLSILVFSPLDSKLNFQNVKFEQDELIGSVNDHIVFKKSVYGYGVSRLFWDIVRKWTAFTVFSKLKEERSVLDWSIVFIDARRLEEQYVSNLRKRYEGGIANEHRELHWRTRFRDYLLKFTLYRAPGEVLDIKPYLEDSTLHFKEISS